MHAFEKGDKTNYKIKAEFIFETSRGATQYDCEGDKIWIPNSIHSFDSETGVLEIPEWFYNREIKNK